MLLFAACHFCCCHILLLSLLSVELCQCAAWHLLMILLLRVGMRFSHSPTILCVSAQTFLQGSSDGCHHAII
jgi:hypothetical protein